MIPKIRRVLYATDLSQNSVYAFRYAVNTAEKHDAEIVILHVIEEIPPAFRSYYQIADTDIQSRKEETIEILSKRLDEFCKSELRERTESLKRIKKVEVKSGVPAEMILSVSNDQNCDVIIMGTHGKGLLTHTFLGSVAERVLKRSRKPIFVIPLPE